MDMQVAAFTDTYLPTVNGVTYTIKNWRDHWRGRGGRMDVVYPGVDEYSPEPGEYPVRSVSFPWYEGYRLGTPQVPRAVDGVDVIHAHTPFALGLGAMRLARKRETPLVASYHTPAAEYAGYLAPTDGVAERLESVSERYERWFFDRADLVVAPSRPTKRHLSETVGTETPVRVLSNGIDTDQFRPVDGRAFRERYDLGDGPLVGYTGRHGYEKRLTDLITAADGLDATVVLGGDGPAREDLERQAREGDGEVRFLGFLDREEMPAFYSALDVFAFPSPVETQGLVAMEANACGTPVVGVDAGALTETIDDGETGYRVAPRDPDALRAGIRRGLADADRLRETCLSRRDAVSVDHAVTELAALYDEVIDAV